MYQYTGYQNQELTAAETEFQRQLQGVASSGRFSQQQIQMIQSIWEQNKACAYAAAKQTLNSPLYGNTLSGFIQGFINTAIKEITTAYQPVSYGYGMPNTMGINPYLNQGYQQMMPMQQVSPFVGGYQPMQGISACAPVNPTNTQPAQINYANVNGNNEQKNNTTQNTEAEKSEKPTLTITKTTFTDPTQDENDTIYGTDEHNTSIGTIKVIAMRDCNGVPFKQVIIRLNEPCRNKMEAYNRARLIYKDRRLSHIDIQYDLAVTLPMEYTKGKKAIASLKKAIPKTFASKNPLKYILSIQSILRDETQGVAEALMEFFINRYNYVGTIGCISSEQNDDVTVKDFPLLVRMCDTEYDKDPNINAWRAKPGFMNCLAKCVNNTIKKDIMDCEVLDPSSDDIRTILRHFTGLNETEEGQVVDVTMELLPKMSEYAKASTKEKMTNFGAAGKMVANTTTIVLKNQHLVYTDLIPDSIVMKTQDNRICVVDKPIYVGGYTEDEPNKADTNFEYMLLKASLASNFWTDLIINVAHEGGASLHSYKCVPTADRWVAIVGTMF